MRLVLDSGGVSALAGQRARLAELRRRGMWPPVVPAPVLTETLTGDHRLDFHANHLLRMSQIRGIDESTARHAATLRTATERAGEITAVDAIVAAIAARMGDDVTILTSDPVDLGDLSAHVEGSVSVVSV